MTFHLDLEHPQEWLVDMSTMPMYMTSTEPNVVPT